MQAILTNCSSRRNSCSGVSTTLLPGHKSASLRRRRTRRRKHKRRRFDKHKLRLPQSKPGRQFRRRFRKPPSNITRTSSFTAHRHGQIRMVDATIPNKRKSSFRRMAQRDQRLHPWIRRITPAGTKPATDRRWSSADASWRLSWHDFSLRLRDRTVGTPAADDQRTRIPTTSRSVALIPSSLLARVAIRSAVCSTSRAAPIPAVLQILPARSAAFRLCRSALLCRGDSVCAAARSGGSSSNSGWPFAPGRQSGQIAAPRDPGKGAVTQDERAGSASTSAGASSERRTLRAV